MATRLYNTRTLCDAAERLVDHLGEWLGWDDETAELIRELRTQARVNRQRLGLRREDKADSTRKRA